MKMTKEDENWRRILKSKHFIVQIKSSSINLTESYSLIMKLHTFFG